VLYLVLGDAGLREDTPTLRRDVEALLTDDSLW